jgi:hypothetical protein
MLATALFEGIQCVVPRHWSEQSADFGLICRASQTKGPLADDRREHWECATY